MQLSWFFPTSRRAWFWLVLRMIFLIVLPISGALWTMMHIPGQSYQGQLAPVSAAEQAVADRMQAHVRTVASEEHNTQHPQALAAAAAYLESQLKEIGYAVASQSYGVGDVQVRNLEVEIKGSTLPQEIIIIGAHYDSAHGAPGANDNGSGTAMVLELARKFKTLAPKRTVRFVLFTNEEPPYFGTRTMGSTVYADRSHARGENIVAMLSLETVGFYDDTGGSQKYPVIFKPFFPSSGNFIAFIGDLPSRSLLHRSIASFRAAQDFPSEGIATFPWIKGVDWSDHSAFWKNGYRALMVTDTAIFRYPYYHTALDTPDRIDYGRMAKVLHGIEAVVADLANTSD
ncbi:MAG: M28 family peptidase [Pseudomonadota bacterium]